MKATTTTRLREYLGRALLLGFVAVGLSVSADGPVRSSSSVIVRENNLGSDPSDFTIFGDSLVFVANDGLHGRELWRIDRDENVTLIGDYVAGPMGSNPSHLTVLTEGLYFLSDVGAGEPESRVGIWLTRGTAATSHSVRFDALQEPLQRGMAGLWRAGEKLIVIAPSTAYGREPTVLDISAEGTFHWRTIDTIPGPWGGLAAGDERPEHFAGATYFIAQGPSNSNRALWRIDSNGAGPMMEGNPQFGFPMVVEATKSFLCIGASHGESGVEPWICTEKSKDPQFLKDINPGEASSFPCQFEEMGGVAFFQADDGIHGKELWRTDGTHEGTWMVADVNPGPVGSAPYHLRAVGSLLLFASTTDRAGTELWVSDGTPGGTGLVADIYPGTESSNLYAPEVIGDQMLFAAHHPGYGEELWRTDGTAEGTWLVRDIAPGAAISEPYNLTAFNGQVYFSANDGEHGAELWRSDGTPVGTRMLADIYGKNHVAASSNPSQLTSCGDYVYFVADDVAHGSELWRSHVETRETALVLDLAPGTAHSDPEQLVVVEDTLFFTAVSGDGSRRLWRVDGEGPIRPVTIPGNQTPRQLLATGGTLLATARDVGGEEVLLRFQGEELAYVVSTTDLFGATGDLGLALVAGQTYLTCRGESTIEFASIDPAIARPRHLDITVPSGADWRDFQAYARARHSGGANGDREALHCYLALPAMANRQAILEGYLYFAAYSPDSGVELWRSNNGIRSAELVKDCFEGRGSSGPAWLMASQGTLLFSAEHAGRGREVWCSHGTPESTYVLDEPHSPGLPGSAPRELLPWMGQVWLSQVGNGLHQGRRTLVGCEEHNGRFHIYGNPEEFNYTAYDPRGLTPHGEYLYFSAESPATGRELWRLGVKPLALELVCNIAQEAGYSENFTVPLGQNY